MRNNKNNISFSVRNITLNHKILTSFYRILTSHFTGKEKILTLRFKNITLCLSILIFSLLNIINTFTYISNVSALDYSSNVDIGFTFLPKLSITLSNPNLIINNLVPGGNAVDSNTIAINVSTNIAEGYNLFATVGGNNSTNNGYNTTNLVNVADNNYTFTSLLSNVSELSNFTNNTWGYSYCISNCSSTSTPDTPSPNWISGDYNNASTGYNGLPLYTNTGIKLVEKADSTNSTVNFKIAAKAGSTQPSGEYTNVINFTAVSNTIPTTMLDAFIASGAEMHNGYFKMQDMTPTICKSIDTDGEKGMQLIDVRDDKVYWVAKLKDGNCWMTQNLDLDLSHEVALTSETSDIDPESYGKTIYTTETGYSKDKDTGVVSWLPSTIDEDGIQRADTIDMVWSSNTAATVPGWTNNDYKPYSADAGDRYRYTDTLGNETVYTSLNSCIAETNNDKTGCQHMQLGNYYNWSTTIASNNTTDATRSQTNSICPNSWKIPTPSEYELLLYTQKIYIGSNKYDNDGYLKVRNFPLYFVQSGVIVDKSLIRFNDWGRYWTNQVYNSTKSYNLAITPNNIVPNYLNYLDDRDIGFSLRCLAR